MRIMPHIVAEVSAVIGTKSRPTALQRTFQSLELQSVHHMTSIVVDASVDSDTRDICERGTQELGSEVQWIKAQEQGAAAQRNQGVTLAKQQMILFFDDDIIFEPNCIARLWQAFQ